MPHAAETHPVLITGGGQRAGLYLAQQLLAQGQPVVISYRSLRVGVEQLTQAGATCIQADFATTEGVLAFAADIKQRFIGLRALIHNASDWAADPPFEEGSDGLAAAAVFQAQFQIHMQTPFLLNQQLATLLQVAARASGQASDIIHITDDALRRGSAKHGAYLASKAGLDNLTLSFAARLAPEVKVNSIAPALLAFNEGDDAAYRHKTLSKSPLYMEPGFEVLWQSVDFLLKQPYMTGNRIQLNGGRHLKG